MEYVPAATVPMPVEALSTFDGVTLASLHDREPVNAW